MASDSRPTAEGLLPLTRGQRFLTMRTWLVLKNLIGWVLIFGALVAGPLVPGPGGLPLFLIGFALISFPGKRRLTARVLRGRPVQFRPALVAVICAGTALIAPALVLIVVRHRPWWFAQARAGAVARGSDRGCRAVPHLGSSCLGAGPADAPCAERAVADYGPSAAQVPALASTSPHPPAAATVATPPSSRAVPRSIPAER